MENASKALLMAGGVLLTMLIVSLLLYAWSMFSSFQATQDELKVNQELTKFNVQFTNYEREDVQGYELLSLVNKVIDYNQRYSSEFDESSTVGNSAAYSPITVNIKLDESPSHYTNRNKLTTSIIVPAVARTGDTDKPYSQIKNNSTYSNPIEKTYNGNTDRLFVQEKYIQSNATNQFVGILNQINSIETYFGGYTKAQDLVKTISTFYEGKIIEYNGQPDDNTERISWFDERYIIKRYKTLIGKDETISNIRKDENVKKILKYYEYIEFKKSEFKCTGITYNKYTGRVASLSFEMK